MEAFLQKLVAGAFEPQISCSLKCEHASITFYKTAKILLIYQKLHAVAAVKLECHEIARINGTAHVFYVSVHVHLRSFGNNDGVDSKTGRMIIAAPLPAA